MVDPAAAQAPAEGAKGQARIEEPSRGEQALARRSAEARATVPDVELTVEVDISACLSLGIEQPHAVTSLLARACALALRDVPRANAAYRDGRFELYSRINVGVTVATSDAYAIPTVFDCDRKPLEQLREEISALVVRAAAGELTASAFAGATFTLSNPGELGVGSSTPLIVPPQAAALSAGAIREVAVVQEGELIPGHAMTIVLACDHRILYGWHAARFLAAIRTRLEQASL